MTDNQIVDGLRDLYGSEFTAADIRGFCASTIFHTKLLPSV